MPKRSITESPRSDSQFPTQDLMLVTAYERSGPVRFVSTEDSVFQVCPALSYFTKQNVSESAGALPVYQYQDNAGKTLFEAQYVPISHPETAVSQLAAFLSCDGSTQPSSVMHMASDRLTAETKHLLSRLLQPILDECHGAMPAAAPLLTTHWGQDHARFLRDLDTVFSKLGLITVERQRQSVTQGLASVQCCGMEVVRYGDDQWKDLQNGYITNGFREKEGRLYGKVIDGWGSAQPDESFRSAALVQFTPKLHTCLTRDRSFIQLLSNAKARTTAPACRKSTIPQQER